MQTVAEALTSPRTVALNAEMAASRVVERHRQLVNEGTAAESKPCAGGGGRRCSDLMMNYSVDDHLLRRMSTLATQQRRQADRLGPKSGPRAALSASQHQGVR